MNLYKVRRFKEPAAMGHTNQFDLHIVAKSFGDAEDVAITNLPPGWKLLSIEKVEDNILIQEEQ
ncbi:MAG: hypothetical protein ACXADB_12580 [Candidatus Hermodarchaeia archaeon]|jgi:hypothetical protein